MTTLERAREAAKTGVKDFDRLVDDAFDAVRGNPLADRLFYALSELGDFSLIWHMLVWSEAGFDDDRLRRAIEFSLVMGAESAIVNGGIKSLFHRERPEWDQDRPHELRRPKTSSFPSGHASAAFCAAAILGRGWRTVPVYLLASLVSASRVHVRIHHGSDVAAGVVTGVILGRIARSVLNRRG